MATSEKVHTAEITRLLSSFPDLTKELEIEIAELDRQMQTLKSKGLIYATEWWRKDSNQEPKYFYLLYPSKTGEKRKRNYIGRDPLLVAEARAGIARAAKYDDLAEEKRELENRASHVLDTLKQTSRVFAGNQW